jgi:carboxyl-terminal processing protease
MLTTTKRPLFSKAFSLAICLFALLMPLVLTGCELNQAMQRSSAWAGSWFGQWLPTSATQAAPVLTKTIATEGVTGKASLTLSTAQLQQAIEAQRLYDEAWHVIESDYLDDTYNGQAWQQWRYRYKGLLHDADDAKVAIDTMLASLNDDYTRFLDAKAYGDQATSIDAELFGVGLQITLKQGRLSVVAPLENTPAQRAGIKAGDWVTAINHQPTAGLSIDACADAIRGPKGTHVTLTLQRDTTAKPFDVTLRRQAIPIESVVVRPLAQAPHIAFIRLNSFISTHATTELEEALKKHASSKALILDLRGNYGGLFSNAVDVANLFMPNQLIVSVHGRTAEETLQYFAQPTMVYAKPMVVLIDGGTASASEIVTASLKDHKRAYLIGTQTFGKGLVQKVVPLPKFDSGLNVTIAHYLTPQGQDINQKGVAPHQEVRWQPPPLTPEQLEAADTVTLLGYDPQVKAAIAYLNKVLAQPTVTQKPHQPWHLPTTPPKAA